MKKTIITFAAIIVAIVFSTQKTHAQNKRTAYETELISILKENYPIIFEHTNYWAKLQGEKSTPYSKLQKELTELSTKSLEDLESAIAELSDLYNAGIMTYAMVVQVLDNSYQTENMSEKFLIAAQKYKSRLEKSQSYKKTSEKEKRVIKGSDYDIITSEIKKHFTNWSQKGEFEKQTEWELRIQKNSSKIFPLICDSIIYDFLIYRFSSIDLALNDYNADKEYFYINMYVTINRKSLSEKGFKLDIPYSEAESFKSNMNKNHLFNYCYFIPRKPTNCVILFDYVILPKEINFYHLIENDLESFKQFKEFSNSSIIYHDMPNEEDYLWLNRRMQIIPIANDNKVFTDESKIKDIIIYFDDLDIDNPYLNGSYYNFTQQKYFPNSIIKKLEIELEEFSQYNDSLQEMVKICNKRLLAYPYNLQHRTIFDSMPNNLLGKKEELDKFLQSKRTILQEKVNQIEKDVYITTKTNNPQEFTKIYYTLNPNQKQLADSTYIECRCKYQNRLSFDIDFIDNTLPYCNCREKIYQEVKNLYHSYEEFNLAYNNSEDIFNQEVLDRKKMIESLKELKENLTLHQYNLKKSQTSKKIQIIEIINRISQHRNSYYYQEAIELLFQYNAKLLKEWKINGIYFDSKTEMFEYWIGEEYDKTLKNKKK